MIPAEPISPVERLAHAFRACEGVRLAYLFGSRARGAARADSDFDIGLLLDDDVAGAERGGTIRRLAGRLGREVPSHLLDLVILNDAPALLRHRVVRDGVVLVERAPEDRVRFVIKMLRDYQDGQIRREWFTRRRIQRLTSTAIDAGSGDLLEKARGVARLLGKAPELP